MHSLIAFQCTSLVLTKGLINGLPGLISSATCLLSDRQSLWTIHPFIDKNTIVSLIIDSEILIYAPVGILSLNINSY